MRAALSLLACLVLLTGCSGTPTHHRTSASPLPHVTLRSFTGSGSLDLARLKGPAVLNVWASWCGPCRQELPQYQAFAEAAAGRVRVIGVDFQDTRAAAARSLIRATGVRYPLFTDPGGSLGARVLPELILVDAHGHVAYRKYVAIDSVSQLEGLVRTHLGVTS